MNDEQQVTFMVRGDDYPTLKAEVIRIMNRFDGTGWDERWAVGMDIEPVIQRAAEDYYPTTWTARITAHRVWTKAKR